ncbi:zinc finger protein 809-like [Bicyclus anynana]|uniref:Zinc finger protein 809-like n=1 Tax=Bicyclus anynana TaxID=110368 RepID=A0ABM3M5G1_BICAN|nr:zinc finger protein 809-like [Bicyclus anynana]
MTRIWSNTQTLVSYYITFQVFDIQSKKDTPLYKNSTYKCPLCFKGYQYEDAYDTHMEQHTDKYGVFECAVCGIHTRSRQKLLHHLNMTHMVRYSCTKCPFFTRHRNTAKSHARWHNGVKSKCKYCDVEFSKLTSLLSHLRKKHPSDQVCTLCGFSFIGERGLALHMQKKHQFDDVQVSMLMMSRRQQADVTAVSPAQEAPVGPGVHSVRVLVHRRERSGAAHAEETPVR